MRGLVLEVVVLVVGQESLQEVSLLGVLPLMLNMGMVGLLTVKIRQPSHEFTFSVGISFIPYPLVLTPRGITSSLVHDGFGV
jgi:hypothetical protein